MAEEMEIDVEQNAMTEEVELDLKHLCSVLYKIIAKCLVNRLRPILGDIISINQSVFVPERLITDNALVAFECIHFIENNSNQVNNFCAYKLDLSKAYDRVDWEFLRKAMERMGFAHRWMDWIMSCVTTVKYSVKFNGTGSNKLMLN
nr:uncharacterized protein LOC127328773 [Lolium perenne]